jgi:type IV secretion system protein VirD4
MESEEESQRPLITPDEVLRIPDENAIVFVAGHRPIWAMKARYFTDPRLARRAALQPPATPEPIPHAWDTWTFVAPDEGAPSHAARAVAATEETGLDSLLPEEDDELHALA